MRIVQRYAVFEQSDLDAIMAKTASKQDVAETLPSDRPEQRSDTSA